MDAARHGPAQHVPERRMPADREQPDPVIALRRLLVAGERFRRATADHAGMSVAESIALTNLTLDGPLTARELAERLQLSTSAVTSVLDRLESAGLAHRQRHPGGDRRQLHVTATPAGFEFIAQRYRRLYDALQCIDADRLPQLAADFLTLADSLDAQAGAPTQVSP